MRVAVPAKVMSLMISCTCEPRPPHFQEGRCKATWKREFKLPWREAGPPNHHDD